MKHTFPCYRHDDLIVISQFPTFSATIMIISYDNDILIFDMNSEIKIISRYYHSIITKVSAKYQNINNQTNDILSWYFDKPQYCTLVMCSGVCIGIFACYGPLIRATFFSNLSRNIVALQVETHCCSYLFTTFVANLSRSIIQCYKSS